MLYEKLDYISNNIRQGLLSILKKQSVKLLFNQDKTNIVKYFCAISEFGEKISEYELETIEILFARQGYPYSVVEAIYQMNYLINNRDQIMTDREHFENAIQLLNDDIVDVTTTEYQSPHKIIWTIVLLKALYGMENLPVFGDALKYLGESFEEFGWTQPPVFFLNNDKMENVFTYYNKDIVQNIKNVPNLEKIILNKQISSTTNNFIENYLRLNASIVTYIEEKYSTINKQIDSVLKG